VLVYSADHFVFDILLGWAYAAVAYLAGNWWWRGHLTRLARLPPRFGVNEA
jgi:hypothetical protein